MLQLTTYERIEKGIYYVSPVLSPKVMYCVCILT